MSALRALLLIDGCKPRPYGRGYLMAALRALTNPVAVAPGADLMAQARPHPLPQAVLTGALAYARANAPFFTSPCANLDRSSRIGPLSRPAHFRGVVLAACQSVGKDTGVRLAILRFSISCQLLVAAYGQVGREFKLRPFSAGSILTFRNRIELPASMTSVERTPRKMQSTKTRAVNNCAGETGDARPGGAVMQ